MQSYNQRNMILTLLSKYDDVFYYKPVLMQLLQIVIFKSVTDYSSTF